MADHSSLQNDQLRNNKKSRLPSNSVVPPQDFVPLNPTQQVIPASGVSLQTSSEKSKQANARYSYPAQPQHGNLYQDSSVSRTYQAAPNEPGSLTIDEVMGAQMDILSSLHSVKQLPPPDRLVNLQGRPAPPKRSHNSVLSLAERQELEAERAAYDDEAGDDLEEEGRDLNDATYNEYHPKKFHQGLPHPDILVESSSLAATDLPDVHYRLSLPERLIRKGLLSAPQLETVCYCSQVQEEWLPLQTTAPDVTSAAKSSYKSKAAASSTAPTQMRKGFFLGDGAGVGKGRQLAGIIYENWLKGRRKHLWFSASADLHLDARRDLSDIGADEIVCHKQLVVRNNKLSLGNGVIFSTYSGLTSTAQRKRRLDQMVEWCGGAEHFEGCIMFDECHKAKNLIPGKSGMKPTQMGLAVKEIQERLPRARVVYCSATGCSEPADMAYMLRLGLWGPRTAFPGGFDAFRRAFDRGGVGMMELVAMHLKRQGQYLCRTLSYHGCTFKVDEQALNQEALRTYDAAAEFWIQLYEQLKQSMVRGDLQYFDRRHSHKRRSVSPQPSTAKATSKRSSRRNGSHDSDSDSDSDCDSLLDSSDISSDEENDSDDDFTNNRRRSGSLLVSANDSTAQQAVLRYFWGAHQRFFRSLCISLKVPRAIEICKEAIAEGKCVVIGLQTTGQAGDDALLNDRRDHHSGFRDVRKELAELTATSWNSDLNEAGLVEGGDLEEEEADTEFASAPAATVKRVIKKLFPLPPVPSSIKRAERKELADLMEKKERKQRKCVASFNARHRPHLLPPDVKAKFGGSKGVLVKRKRQNAESEDDELFAGSADDFQQSQGQVIDSSSDSDSDSGSDEVVSAAESTAHSDNDDEFDLTSHTPPRRPHNAADDDEVLSPAPKGLGKGINGWSILRTEGWITVNPSDPASFVSDVVEATATQEALPTLSAAQMETVMREAQAGAMQVSRPVRKTFKRKSISGFIVAYLPKSLNDGEELWHVVFEDADEEDWDPVEVEEGISEFAAFCAVEGNKESEPLSKKEIATKPPAQKKEVALPPRKSRRLTIDSDSPSVGGSPRDDLVVGSDVMAIDVPKTAAGGKKLAFEAEGTTEGKTTSSSSSKSATSSSSRSKANTMDLCTSESDTASVGSNNTARDMLTDLFAQTILPPEEEKEVQIYSQRLAFREEQMAALDKLHLPGNPLDIIIDSVGGPQTVAEMTGRKSRLVRDETSGKLVYSSRNDNLDCSMQQRNIVERDLFQQGVKNIAIISEVASAGISLHADRRAKNQRRRVHITLELPWSADRAVQQLGRTHRSNQSSGPEYYLLISPQGGERRFAAAVAKRLESLGALTQGDRSATVGAKNMSITDFNFDTKYGKKAIVEIMNLLMNHVRNGSLRFGRPTPVPYSSASNHSTTIVEDDDAPIDTLSTSNNSGNAASTSTSRPTPEEKKSLFIENAIQWLKKVDVSVANSDHHNVPRFLNRILGIPSKWQRKLFDLFSATLDSLIRQAKLEKSYDQGIMEVRGSNIQVQPGYPQQVWRNVDAAGASADVAGAHSEDKVLHYVVKVDRGCTWADALQVLEQVRADETRASAATVADSAKKSTNKRNTSSVTGFYLTRNPYQGKHFIALILDKGNRQNVVIVRPSTGRNEMSTNSFKEKYEPLTSLQKAEKLWRAQYDEAGVEEEGGVARRYLLHHLLTGSVLAVWSRIEAVYEVYNSYQDATNGSGHKKFAMRIARIVLNNTEAAPGKQALSPAKSSSRSRASSEVATPSSSQISSLSAIIPAPVNSLVGIWVPSTRIKEVVRTLKKYQEDSTRSKMLEGFQSK